MVIFGPSGCGKTTLLRMIAGLEKPSSGKIFFGEREVTAVPAKDRNVSMVFQSNALYPHLSVRRNIEFPLKMRKVKPTERRKLVEQVAEDLEISELLDRKIDQLSGGQQRRVAIGRAIVRSPVLFLFDEPLTNLDSKLKQQTLTLIADLQKKLAVTMLFVTHDREEAEKIGHRVIDF